MDRSSCPQRGGGLHFGTSRQLGLFLCRSRLAIVRKGAKYLQGIFALQRLRIERSLWLACLALTGNRPRLDCLIYCAFALDREPPVLSRTHCCGRLLHHAGWYLRRFAPTAG